MNVYSSNQEELVSAREQTCAPNITDKIKARLGFE